MGCRKSFKMGRVNIEVVKLTPEERTEVPFMDLKICRFTVNQVKFWLKCRRINQGGNKKKVTKVKFKGNDFITL